MTKRYILPVLVLLVATGLHAKERTTQQKRQLALSVLKDKTPTRAATSGNIEELKTMSGLTVMGYAGGGGFAVISNDDRNEAVLGWSDGRFDAENISDGLEWWLDMANGILESGNAYTRTITPATAGGNSLPERVESFVTARWGQGEPYNQECPLISGTRAVTGCVATAAAQIMYYYGYPAQGAGESMFDPVSFVFVDFAGTTYDYAAMIPDYSGGYTSAQAEAVATLMYHCGMAAEMSYGASASGAYSYKAAGAWRDRFSYSTEFYRREAYPQDEWMSIIYNELGNLRPIQYGGVDENQGGHSFVFDGYDADGLVHVNWGWEGIDDGYYDVALLNPQYYSFYAQQEMILMHTPDAPELPYRSQWGIMPAASYGGSFTVTVSGDYLTFMATMLLNIDSEDFMGQLALMAEPAGGGTAVPVYTYTPVGSDGSPTYVGYTSGYSSFGDVVDISGLGDGTYYVYLASKADQPEAEDTWQPVHYGEDIDGKYTLTITDGSATVTTGIDNVIAAPALTEGQDDNRIYGIDGRYVGTDDSKLGKGLYIRGGKKFIKK